MRFFCKISEINLFIIIRIMTITKNIKIYDKPLILKINYLNYIIKI